MTLPALNPDKPTVSASGFGRVFFGGGSTVYYSPILENISDLGRCYQKADPTSDSISDLLATDGGRILLKDAGNIISMYTYNTGVLVFTDKGIWYIYNNETGFLTTSFSVRKITSEVIASKTSLIEAQGILYFGTSNGLNVLYPNENNFLAVESITDGVIRDFYIENMSEGFRASYDTDSKNIWFLSRSSEPTKDLVYNTVAKAFYPQDLNRSGETYQVNAPLTLGNSDVVFNISTGQGTASMSYNLADLSDETFQDLGTDIEAYIVSGYETLQAPAKHKSIKYGTFFFKKTETQITSYDEINEEYVFDKPSACKLQVRWDFDNSSAFNRFTGSTSYSPDIDLYKPMQRGFIPDETFPYTFDTGEDVISKKVKLRGRGKAVQFKFEAQSGKDMQLLGYSAEYTIKGRQ